MDAPAVNSLIANRRFLSLAGPHAFNLIVARSGLYQPRFGNAVNRAGDVRLEISF